MTTIVTAVKHSSNIWYRKIFPFFCKIETKNWIEEIESIKFLHTYLFSSKKSAWRSISNMIEENREILCKEDLHIPKGLDIYRFTPSHFYERLCENAAIEILRRKVISPSNMSLSLYDTNGVRLELLKFLSPLCGQINILTNRPDLYEEECKRLHCETGSSIDIYEGNQSPSDYHLLLAPEPITKEVSLSKHTIILTSAEPSISLKAPIYYRYHIEASDQYFAPEDLEQEYFLAYLYERCKKYELGSLIPDFCSNPSSKLSIDQLCHTMLDLWGS